MQYTKEQIEKINLPILHVIGEEADKLGYQCYIIGGWVRDLIMNRPNDDIDIVVVGSGKKIAEAVAKKIDAAKVTIYESYGTAQIITKDNLEVEFVGARKEFYHRESRNPIVEDGTLQDDMDRRDFTINDMAICLNTNNYGDFIDPYNGLEYIKARLIKCVGNPKDRFYEDPLRMLRAIRFAARFNYKIENSTFNAICKSAERIKIIVKERIADEFCKMLISDCPYYAMQMLKDTGLLKIIMPELDMLNSGDYKGAHHKNVFLHSLLVLDEVAEHSKDLYIRLAALLHDIGKPKTLKIINGTVTYFNHADIGAKMIQPLFMRMGLPLDNRMKFVEKLVKLHMRPMQLCEEGVSDAAIRRMLVDAGDDIDSLLILCNADITTSHDDKKTKFQENYTLLKQRMIELEESDHLRNFQPPINGNEIMEMFNLSPCKIVGTLKDAVKDAILDGTIKNNYEEAKQYVINLYNNY